MRSGPILRFLRKDPQGSAPALAAGSIRKLCSLHLGPQVAILGEELLLLLLLLKLARVLLLFCTRTQERLHRCIHDVHQSRLDGEPSFTIPRIVDEATMGARHAAMNRNASMVGLLSG